MEKIFKNEIVKEKIYFRSLPSKIECYIIPKKGFIEKNAMIATKYGSIDSVFEICGKKIETPDGIAHFLEHKMFEDEKLNMFDEFNKLGADVNAFTNYNNTAYYFNCIENFKDNLELLLDLVFKPYFTDENIEKEKGIIEQEINMYQDYASWKVYFNMQDAMYKNLAIKKDIAGTVDSIKKINKEILTKCYETFYQPQNMIIVCSGDILPEYVYSIVEKKLKNKNNKEFKKCILDEPFEVNKNYIEEKMTVSIPNFNLGFKDNNKTDSKSDLLAVSKILIDIIAGESSVLYEKLYNKGLIDSTFSMEYTSGLNYGTSIFSGNSYNPKMVKKEILSEIKKYCHEGIDRSRFEQIKRKHIGRYIRIFNSIDLICNLQVDFLSKDMDLFSLIDSFNKITLDMVNNRLKEHLYTDNYVLSVILPK